MDGDDNYDIKMDLDNPEESDSKEPESSKDLVDERISKMGEKAHEKAEETTSRPADP